MEVTFIWIEGNSYVLCAYKELKLPKDWYYENGIFISEGWKPGEGERVFQAKKEQPDDPYITEAKLIP